ARCYILAIIALGAGVFGAMLPRASFSPILPLLLLILLSSLTAAFKVQFSIASGSNMSVSYVVDIASLILRGPHATMLVSAASGWSQTKFNAKTRNPLYRTLFNMAMLLLAAAPLYLTYKLYRAGAESEARQGAILEAAHDAIITMDARLDIREFNPAAERMFGHARLDILGRNIALLLPAADRGRRL